MKWTKTKLANYIKDEVRKKSKLTLKDGDFSKQDKEFIEAIAAGISYGHSEWQNVAKINNVIVNGGTCTPLGPLGSPSIGIASVGCISLKINSNTIKNQTYSFLPGKNIVELSKHLKSLIISISDAFSKIYNEWLSTLIINNIQVNGGFCSCQIPPASPIGTYSGGIGTLSTLNGNIPLRIQKDSLKNEILQQLKNYLLLDEGSYSKYLLQYVEAMTDGIISMQNEWLNGTQVQQLQVNGGTSVFSGPLIASIGSLGVFI